MRRKLLVIILSYAPGLFVPAISLTKRAELVLAYMLSWVFLVLFLIILVYVLDTRGRAGPR